MLGVDKVRIRGNMFCVWVLGVECWVMMKCAFEGTCRRRDVEYLLFMKCVSKVKAPVFCRQVLDNVSFAAIKS